jgi:dihydrofolate synthase/folylpolyglutamate synthase
VATAAAETLVPGRLQVVDSEPVTVLDGAHNPEGMAALAEALDDPFAAGLEPVVAVVSILDDKDAAGMLSLLIPKCDGLVLTASQNPRALPPPTLASLAGQLGGPPAEVVRDPRAAVARAREIAGPHGLVVATGTIYLVADLLRPAGAGRASML